MCCVCVNVSAGRPVAGNSAQSNGAVSFNAGRALSTSQSPSPGYSVLSVYQQQQQQQQLQNSSVDFDNLATINQLMSHASLDINKPRVQK